MLIWNYHSDGTGERRLHRKKVSIVYDARASRTTKPVSSAKGNNCVVSSLFHNIFPYLFHSMVYSVVTFYGSRTGNSVS